MLNLDLREVDMFSKNRMIGLQIVIICFLSIVFSQISWADLQSDDEDMVLSQKWEELRATLLSDDSQEMIPLRNFA